MNLLFWKTDGSLGKQYVPITFEDLAERVHEMAAVAWDRDCEDILTGREIRESLRVLVSRDGAVTMHHDTNVFLCFWDPDLLKWTRKTPVRYLKLFGARTP